MFSSAKAGCLFLVQPKAEALGYKYHRPYTALAKVFSLLILYFLYSAFLTICFLRLKPDTSSSYNPRLKPWVRDNAFYTALAKVFSLPILYFL